MLSLSHADPFFATECSSPETFSRNCKKRKLRMEAGMEARTFHGVGRVDSVVGGWNVNSSVTMTPLRSLLSANNNISFSNRLLGGCNLTSFKELRMCSVCQSVRPSVRSSIRPSVRPFVRPSVRPSVPPSVPPSVCRTS